MDSYNNFMCHKSDSNTHNLNRVYVNPNFQRNNAGTTHNGHMYVNPQFHHYPNLQPSIVNKPKIHVNPNFVRSSATVPSFATHYSANPVFKNVPTSSFSTVNNYYTPITSNIKTETINYYPTTNILGNNYYTPTTSNAKISTTETKNYYEAANKLGENIYVNSTISTVSDILHQSTSLPIVSAVSKSRYSLVRQKPTVANVLPQTTSKNVTKLKISKYKTVSVEQVKKKTEKIEPAQREMKGNVQVLADTTKTRNRPDFFHTRFKLVKKNIVTTAPKNYVKTPTKRRHSLNSSKVLLRSIQRAKLKDNKMTFKTNNIPCPLFKKFGTCLRNIKGKCEFLHDKRHVSICRRFLKGICHDKNCLLSHQIIAEKMPTCSFYLRGMCTKEDCPYLHVKLNEKAKICLDFLKGYCEKGDKCLNRHVNICPDQAAKGVCCKKRCPYPHKSNNRQKVQTKTKTKVINQITKSAINRKKSQMDKVEVMENVNSNKDNKDNDCRYYTDIAEDTSLTEVEVIKPTRCKLGALPSFIQL